MFVLSGVQPCCEPLLEDTFLSEPLFTLSLPFWSLNRFRTEPFLEFFCFVFGCLTESFVEAGMRKTLALALEWFGIARFIK